MELFYELYGNLWTTEDIHPNPHSYKNSVFAKICKNALAHLKIDFAHA